MVWKDTKELGASAKEKKHDLELQLPVINGVISES